MYQHGPRPGQPARLVTKSAEAMSSDTIQESYNTYMNAPVCTARINVLLASRLRGAEVAADERPEDLVARVLHDTAV